MGVQNCLVVVEDGISQPEGCERVTNGMEMRERDANGSGSVRNRGVVIC